MEKTNKQKYYTVCVFAFLNYEIFRRIADREDKLDYTATWP